MDRKNTDQIAYEDRVQRDGEIPSFGQIDRRCESHWRDGNGFDDMFYAEDN